MTTFAIGQRVSASVYGKPMYGIVTKLANRGSCAIVWVRFDGSRHSRFMFPESLKRASKRAQVYSAIQNASESLA